MSVNVPTHDFVTSSLVDAIDNSQDTMTIGAGLNIPATNGALQIDYDSSIAVGTASGPETVLYATYTTATGAVAGMTRASGGTTAVAHDALASVQCGNSSVYYEALSALYDGWITANETWTRTANTTFTITGDFTDVYAIGDKLKVTDTTTKYFYITAVSYSAPDTTVTIIGDVSAPLAATPTARWYSKSSSPVGFPQWFNWTPTLFKTDTTTPLTGTLKFSRFAVNGRTVNGVVSFDPVSNPSGNAICFVFPITSKPMSVGNASLGGGYGYNGGSTHCRVENTLSIPTLGIVYNIASVSWAASSNIFSVNFTYEI